MVDSGVFFSFKIGNFVSDDFTDDETGQNNPSSGNGHITKTLVASHRRYGMIIPSNKLNAELNDLLDLM